uniref:Uncharacterized protein n=1 Tax=Pseudo-nitzschia australis TaxID=44445 RepID=A0A7S4AIX8_9STRA
MGSSKEEITKRLSRAAEEIAKAASDETDSISTSIQREVASNILDLKEESAAQKTELVALKSDVNALKSDVNNKLNTVNQNLRDLHKSIHTLLSLIQEEGKISRIQNALQCIKSPDHLDEFNKVIVSILGCFSRGEGCNVDKHFKHYQNREYPDPFMTLLKVTIHPLIGKAPRVAKDSNEEWCIWYE